MPPELPKRPPPLPDRGPILDQQPERGDVRHVGVDGAPQRPLKRTDTLPQMAALKAPPVAPGAETPLPAPAAVPTEHAPTLKAPAQSPLRRTWRLPTPPSALAAARRTPVPPPDDSSPDSEGPQSLPEAQEAILRRALADERAKVAQLERDARAAAEARQETFPPKVQPQRHPSPAPSSAPNKVDAAIGKAVRTTATRLAERFGLVPLLVMLGLGGGVVAVAKPAADPAKTDAIEARVSVLEREQKLTRTQVNGGLDRDAILEAFTLCLYEQQGDYFPQLLPSTEKLGSAGPMKQWIDRCKNRKP